MTNRRYEIGVDETNQSNKDDEDEYEEQECEEEDLLSDDDEILTSFNPVPYHFKLKDVLGEPVDLLPEDMAKVRVNSPPFHTLLDHCLAVLWLVYNRGLGNRDLLESGDLNWAIKFLEGLKDERNRRTEDVQMAVEQLQRILHNLCVSVHVDDVIRWKYKRYMDLSRSFNTLKFNRTVIQQNVEKGAPDYAAFVKCMNKKDNATMLNSTFGPGNDECVTPTAPFSSTCQTPCPSPCPTTCQSPCPSTSQTTCQSPCPDPCGESKPCEEAEPETDVCEMLDLLGDTPPIALMDLLDHNPELLAKAMAKEEDDCGVTIAEMGSGECIAGDEDCMLRESMEKEAKKDRLRDALCQIKHAESIIAEYFKLVDEDKSVTNIGSECPLQTVQPAPVQQDLDDTPKSSKKKKK